MQSNEQANDFQNAPDYGRQKGLWIPETILYCDSVGASEKMLLSLVYNLESSGGCYASNSFLAHALGWPIKSVERVLYSLRDAGIVNIAHSQTGRRLFINALENEGTHPRKRGAEPSKMRKNTLENEGHNINNIKLIQSEYKSAPIGAVVDLFGNSEQGQPGKKAKPSARDWNADAEFVELWKVYNQMKHLRNTVGQPGPAYKFFDKLNRADKEAMKAKLPAIVRGHIETGVYPKDFERFIKNRLWEAEPLGKTQPNGQPAAKKRLMAPGMGW